ncbi:MAG: hypothetical protein ABIJ37_02610 [Pseudomonadota bacterium]
MKDPHIVSLRYKLETISNVTFNDSPSIKDEIDSFQVFLDNGMAIVTLKDHFESIPSARKFVDAYFRAWELGAALNFNREVIKFVFEDAEVIDRDPPPPGSPIMLQPLDIASASFVGKVTASVSKHEYPLPPKDFRVNPDVETLWNRFNGYIQGNEPLLSMAYFILTFLEARANGRKKAGELYLIHKNVLDKLGELTAERGDEKTARKIKKTNKLMTLNHTETCWIEAIIKAIIRRVGEIDVNPSPDILTMKDLPML